VDQISDVFSLGFCRLSFSRYVCDAAVAIVQARRKRVTMPPSNRIVQAPLVCHGHTRPIVELCYRSTFTLLTTGHMHSRVCSFRCMEADSGALRRH
jgi:hypothetical protein